MLEDSVDPETDLELAEVQGTVAGVRPELVPDHTDGTKSIDFMDKKFRIASSIGLMPLLKFSAASDMNVQDPRALAAMYTMLRDCIYPGTPACGECEACKNGEDTNCRFYDRGDWGDFEEHAMLTKAGADDLLDVVTKVIELISGRPTSPPGTSSPGRRTSSAGSTGTSSGRRGKGSRR
jgi:hypothetical protein